MHIEIELPRPYLTLSLLIGAVVFVWSQATTPPSLATASVVTETPTTAAATDLPANTHAPQGGNYLPPAEEEHAAEENLRRGFTDQEMLDQKEEWLRYQLKMLEAERKALGPTVDPGVEEEFRESTRRLLSLLQDQQKTEAFILESLNQLREAQGTAAYIGKGLHGTPASPVRLVFWPVEPGRGISAFFRDLEYEKHFGFPHDGVDIPALQGTTIVSVSDGVVRKVSDQNGYGFNSVTIDHENGAVTLYGHITKSLVTEGARVKAGEPIAQSGGRPGSTGAGTSTGPHVHLELFVNGEHVDPMDYLPRKVLPEYGANE